MSSTTKASLVAGIGHLVLAGTCLRGLVTYALCDGPPAGSAPAGTVEGALDGRDGGFQPRGAPGLNRQLQPMWFAAAIPGFSIAGSNSTDATTNGTVEIANNVSSFKRGGLDGYRGLR